MTMDGEGEDQVFIARDGDEPRFASLREMAQCLWGFGWITIEELKKRYRIPEARWPYVAKRLAGPYREVRKSEATVAVRIDEMNAGLSELALACPPYANRGDMDRLIALLRAAPRDDAALEAAVFECVMGPATRARLLVGRYKKMRLTKSFAYLIDAAYFAYARGNLAAAILTVLPTVEGLLRRWRGGGPSLVERVPFADWARWVEDTPKRQPLLDLPHQAESWSAAAGKILRDHFYLPSEDGEAFSNFNRHLALHLVDDRKFCSPANLMRTFLLLDILSLLYMSEHWEPDPMMLVKPEEERPHAELYRSVMLTQVRSAGSTPEEALWRYDQLNLRGTSNR